MLYSYITVVTEQRGSETAARRIDGEKRYGSLGAGERALYKSAF